MNTISNLILNDDDFLNLEYNFQPELTSKLDEIDSDFTQEIINEIVLWKVNRYSNFDSETLNLLNKIDKNEKILNENLTIEVLGKLLNRKGVQLAMASTILRFKNPNIYQIIDQRVYRFIYGESLPSYYSSIEKQIEIYIAYLKELKSICEEKNIDFHISDRILYELDKKYNKDKKIKY